MGKGPIIIFIKIKPQKSQTGNAKDGILEN